MHVRVLLAKYRSYTPCHDLQWRAAQGRGAAVAARGPRAARIRPQHPRMMLLPIDRCLAFFERPRAARAARRSRRPAARRSALAARLPGPRRPRLPDARPPVAHALGRRGAAHQPDHGARHVAGQHAVRARRALDRPASARHAPRDRGDAPPARQRQLAAGRRARPADHADGRPRHRHGAGPGRARRPDRVRRHARRTRGARRHAHGAVPVGPPRRGDGRRQARCAGARCAATQ